MASFGYVAIAANGKEKKGSMEAKDAERVRAALKAEGLIPVSVTEQGLMSKDIQLGGGKKVTPRDLGVFCRQFGSVLSAGVTVVSALEMMQEQTENKRLREAIGVVKQGVEKGQSLGDSMRMAKEVFPGILINMVDAGEASGSLDLSFERMAGHFEKAARLRSLVKKAFAYPIVLVVVTIIVVIVMSIVVVPKFATMFKDLGADLPWITQAVMNMSSFIIHKWYLLFGIVIVLVVGIRMYKKTENGQVFFGTLAIKAPIIGPLNVKTAAASFARTFSTLSSTGVPVSTAIDITARSLENILYRRALEKARSEVEQGIPLSDPLKKAGIFPPMVHHMCKIGEETGQVEEMLGKVADYYEEEVEITTQSLTALMEPLIIVFMGVVIGFIVLALYMPMVDMYKSMG